LLLSTSNLLCQSILIDAILTGNLLVCKGNLVEILNLLIRIESKPNSESLKNILTLNGHVLVYQMKIEIDRLSYFTIF